MDDALIIAIIALCISMASLYYQHLRKGKILFGEPNMHFLWRDENDFLLAVPLALTNTGSFSHTINYLIGMLYSKNGDDKFEFQVSKIIEGFSVENEKESPEFVGIGVESRSSISKLVSFRAKDKYIPDGEYIFELSGCLDGSIMIVEDLLSFDFEIDEEIRKGLIPNKHSVVHHFEYETLKQMTAKKKKIHFSILLCLRILVIGFFLSLFIIMLIYSFTAILPNPLTAIITFLVLTAVSLLAFMIYDSFLTRTVRKTIKQTRERRNN